MPDVQISGRTVTIQRFTLSKAMRIITLLGLIQKQVPEVTREYAEFTKEYGKQYPEEYDRMRAALIYGERALAIPDEEWAKHDGVLTLPGAPSKQEAFLHMAPLVYEKAEAVVLRLLGLIAMPNETVSRYVKEGDIWNRVDEFVDEVIRDAPLDEIMELAITACEVIDGQVLTKARGLGDRAGNAARLFGIKTSQRSEDSPTSNEQPDEQSIGSASLSPSDTTGPLTTFSDSPTTASSTSATSENVLTGTPS